MILNEVVWLKLIKKNIKIFGIRLLEIDKHDSVESGERNQEIVGGRRWKVQFQTFSLTCLEYAIVYLFRVCNSLFNYINLDCNTHIKGVLH